VIPYLTFAAGALCIAVLAGFVRDRTIRNLRAQLTDARIDAQRWRTEAERLRLEGAEDRARVALFTMGER